MTGQSLPRLGDYLLIERVGEGGMAEVFRAQYSGDEHSVGPMSVVVVKRIKPELFNKPEFPIFREMFLNEAKLVRSLQHPNLARVYALLEAVDPDIGRKIPFIVQEFVRGHQLWELLRIATRGFTGLGVPGGIAAFIAREMSRGLGHAHSHKDAATGKLQPIIHRDISPENVMVSAEGSIKVIDFGVAKALGGFGPQTRTGIIKGKLAYMAPEQVAQKVVPATDVFGVGIVLHEMLTGRRLFGGHNDFIVISRVLKAEIPRPSQLITGIPKELDEVVMTALSRDLKVRYVDGNALADALTRAMAKVPGLKGTTETSVKQWVKQVIAEGQKISSNWNEEESGVHVDVDGAAAAMSRVEGSSDDLIELTADDLMKTELDGPMEPGVRAAVTMGLKTLRPDMLAKASSRPSLAPVNAQALLGGSAAEVLGVSLPGMNRSGARPAPGSEPTPAAVPAAASGPAATPSLPRPFPTPPPQPVVGGTRTPPPQPVVGGKLTPPPQPVVGGKPTPPPQPMVGGKPTPPPQPMVGGKPTPPPQPMVAGHLTPSAGSGRDLLVGASERSGRTGNQLLTGAAERSGRTGNQPLAGAAERSGRTGNQPLAGATERSGRTGNQPLAGAAERSGRTGNQPLAGPSSVAQGGPATDASPASSSSPSGLAPLSPERVARLRQPTPLAGYAKIDPAITEPAPAPGLPLVAPAPAVLPVPARSPSVESALVPTPPPVAPRPVAPPPAQTAAPMPAFFDKQIERWIKLIAALVLLALILVALLIFRD